MHRWKKGAKKERRIAHSVSRSEERMSNKKSNLRDECICWNWSSFIPISNDSHGFFSCDYHKRAIHSGVCFHRFRLSQLIVKGFRAVHRRLTEAYIRWCRLCFELSLCLTVVTDCNERIYFLSFVPRTGRLAKQASLDNSEIIVPSDRKPIGKMANHIVLTVYTPKNFFLSSGFLFASFPSKRKIRRKKRRWKENKWEKKAKTCVLYSRCSLVARKIPFETCFSSRRRFLRCLRFCCCFRVLLRPFRSAFL